MEFRSEGLFQMLLDQVSRRVREILKGRRSATASPTPLFFMHIPKNAGTSLIYLLANRFPAEACLFYADRPVSQAQDPNQFQFISGHVALQYLERFRRRPNVVTFLRHPLDRAMSRYYFTQSFTPEQLQETYRQTGQGGSATALRIAEQRLDLSDFLRREPELSRAFFSNAQTCYLAGVPNMGDVREYVSQACENLTRCEVIGLAERFEDSVDLLCHRLGWEPFTEIRRRNATPQRLKMNDLDDATQATLTEYLAPDLALYEFGKKLFEERLQAAANSDQSPRKRSPKSALPNATDYTLDRPIIGAGWHPRENNGSTWSCWTGPGTDSWLEFQPVKLRNRKLRCELFHAVDPQVLQSVQVRINDQPIALEHHLTEEGQVVLEGNVPAEAMKANRDRLRISFCVNNRWRPCDLDPTSSDDRWLGINVSRLSLKRAA